MKKELATIFENPASSLGQLIGSDLPFALWQLPNQSTDTLLVDLGESAKTYESLETMRPGFLVNDFKSSHPVSPTVINADLLIEDFSGSQKVNFDPIIKDTTVDELVASGQGRLVDLHDHSIEAMNHFEAMTQTAIHEIESGKMFKVVLARYIDLERKVSFDPYRFYNTIRKEYPRAFSYLIYTPKHGLWIGATPEKLIGVNHDTGIFTTDSLAGTQPIGSRSVEEVGWTMKEIEEQAMVSRYIVDCFKKIRLREFDEIGPKTVQAANLAHLKTEFSVDMGETRAENLGSIMLDLLHPTSAVCGFPRKTAMDFIKRNEGFNRELYSGFLGPVHIRNQTNLYVNLRCMRVYGNKIRLFAGAGITKDSIPNKEFLETNHKINTLRNLL